MDGKLFVQTDCFPSEAGRDSRISGARGAAPCTERSDAKQPGLPSSGLSASQSARIQGLPCIEVRPLFQRDVRFSVSPACFPHSGPPVILILNMKRPPTNGKRSKLWVCNYRIISIFAALGYRFSSTYDLLNHICKF